MGFGVGFGYVAEGLMQGAEDVRRREMQDEERQFRDEQRQYMREERDYQRQRRGIIDQRNDEEYDYKKRHREFSDGMKKALGRFVATRGADYQQAVDLMNREFDDNVQVKRNTDGTYTLLKDYGSGLVPVQGAEKLDFDALGTMFYSVLDPATYLKAKAERKAQKPIVVGDGASLVDPSGRVLYTNPKDATGGSGGKGGGLGEKEIANQAYKRARSSWGSLGPNGVFNLDGRNAKYANVNERLTVALYRRMPDNERDITAAHDVAYKIVRAMKDREDFAGEIPGASTFYMGADDVKKAADFVSKLFPMGGTEKQVRDLLAKGGIDDKSDQEKVVMALKDRRVITGVDPIQAIIGSAGADVRQKAKPQTAATPGKGVAPNAASPASSAQAATTPVEAGRDVARREPVDRSIVIPDGSTGGGQAEQTPARGLPKVGAVTIAPPPPRPLPAGVTAQDLLEKAKQAVAAGKSRAAVAQRLMDYGISKDDISAAGII